LTRFMEILRCNPFGDLAHSTRMLTAMNDTFGQKISEATSGKFEHLKEEMQNLLREKTNSATFLELLNSTGTPYESSCEAKLTIRECAF